jgi:hypothetical protein
MAVDRIRGQETTLQVSVGNQTQEGSFSKVESFKWNPRQDLTDTDFVGETESEPDIMHHGYDLSFTIHEKENGAVDNVLLPIVAALTAGQPLPRVTLTFIKRYRDPSVPTKVLVFQNVKLKMDSQEAGGRKDYVKTQFSGKCRKMQSF